jgi:hypothetical protein
MRKINAILSMAIMALFLVHMVAGILELSGLMAGGSAVLSVVAWVMAALIAVHAIIGIKLSADSIIACKKAGVSYFRENKLFWARRISGFAVMVFLIVHILIFRGSTQGGFYRLNLFAGAQLVSQILMVLSIAVHVITNVKPSLISLGIRSLREYAVDILLVLSLLLLIAGAAFVVYYLRWM